MLCCSAFPLCKKRWHAATQNGGIGPKVQLSIDAALGMFLVMWIYFTSSGNHFYTAAWIWSTQRVDDGQVWVESTVKWLMGWPAGLKLNENLDNALGNTFLWVSDKHRKILSLVPEDSAKKLLLVVLPIVCLSGQVCIIGDLMRYFCFGNICLWSFAIKLLYKTFVQVLVALWRLFRGHKYNPLRRRVDTCVYTLDELFVGTLAFVVACYLVPSVAAYHYFFSFWVYCANLVESVFWTVFAFVFSFPASPLFSWIFSPSKTEKEIIVCDSGVPTVIVNNTFTTHDISQTLFLITA